jgi:hypothetical protein
LQLIILCMLKSTQANTNKHSTTLTADVLMSVPCHAVPYVYVQYVCLYSI